MRSTAVPEHVQRRRPSSRASTSSSGRSTPTAKAERPMPAGPGRARVRFDTHALADDLARHSPPGQTALRHAHDRFQRERVPLDRPRACQDEHRARHQPPRLPQDLPPRLRRRLADELSDRDRRERAAAQRSRPRGSVISRAAHELPTPARSPTIAFTADGPGDGCRDATDAAPNDPRCDAQRPGRRPETRRLDSWGPTAGATLPIKSRSHQAQRRDYPTLSNGAATVANAVAVATRVEAVAGRWARRLAIAG
jgi:hypothetical protein